MEHHGDFFSSDRYQMLCLSDKDLRSGRELVGVGNGLYSLRRQATGGMLEKPDLLSYNHYILVLIVIDD